MEFDTQKFVKLIHREMNTNLQSFFLFFPLHPISQIFRQNNQYFFLSPLFISQCGNCTDFTIINFATFCENFREIVEIFPLSAYLVLKLPICNHIY